MKVQDSMKVLIITPFFFDYHNRIKRALEKRGAQVTLIEERPSTSVFAKIFMRKDVKFYHKTIEKYYDKKEETKCHM